MDKDTIKKMVEGKLMPGDVDPQVLAEYERAAKVMKATMMAKLLKSDFEPAEVVPNVFLGSIGAAQKPDHLRELGVTHVLCVGHGLPRKVGDDFAFKAVEVFDSAETRLIDHFDECFEFIEDAISSAGKVLVHCFAGKSRSAAVVIAYMIRSTQMEYHEAFDVARKARPIINPNPGFCLQLVQFYKTVHPERPPPGIESPDAGCDTGPDTRGDADGDPSCDAACAGEAGNNNAFMQMVEKAGRSSALLYRDESMIVFHEKFGVCKHHLTIVPAKPLNGVRALSGDDLPLLRALFERGVTEFENIVREVDIFQGEDISQVVVAGFFHPNALEHLQLHMLLPPFRSERVCAYPRWHSYAKIIADLEASGQVVPFDEAPNPQEGKYTQDAALALHRRFKAAMENNER